MKQMAKKNAGKQPAKKQSKKTVAKSEMVESTTTSTTGISCYFILVGTGQFIFKHIFEIVCFPVTENVAEPVVTKRAAPRKKPVKKVRAATCQSFIIDKLFSSTILTKQF